jgi:hypothetical protein
MVALSQKIKVITTLVWLLYNLWWYPRKYPRLKKSKVS